MTLMGGFAGVGASDPNARDITEYETILSGDLAGNDVLSEGPGGSVFAEDGVWPYNERQWCLVHESRPGGRTVVHVVTSSGVDQTAVLDGFTITAGNAFRSAVLDGRLRQASMPIDHGRRHAQPGRAVRQSATARSLRTPR